MIPKNKTISILHPYLNKRGGAVNMMVYLSNLLQKEGNRVVFYTFTYDKDLFSKDINFEVITGNKLTIAYKIRKSDYIIIGNSPMQFAGAFSRIFFFSGAKLIWWHHHYPWYYSENTNFLILIKRYLEKFIIKFIDELVANSEYLRLSLEIIYKRKSKILYPTIILPSIDSSFSKEKESKIIFAYARWVKGKNVRQIFETYEYLKGKVSNLELWIGGVGDELEPFEKEYKQDKNVKLLGMLDKLSIMENFSNARVFLFPSKIDSFGMTVLEASYCGVPTIAFDINSAKELIENNKSGFLVKDSQEFNEKALELLEHYDLCKQFGKESKKKALVFSPQEFYKRLSKIF